MPGVLLGLIMGKVYLLGAGPGDPGLLTIRAKEVLEECDVLIYDFLANEVFLRLVRPTAEVIYVGKQGGKHTLSQDKINQLLVDKARAGKQVARLKGGDPYVFGRGGEEAEVLVENGVEFEVVPGVTSAIAAAAYAGIPLTHRSYASSVSFITGHEDPSKPESVHNWSALARSASTLVFFMGVKNLGQITTNLIGAGLDPKTPAALVRWGTTCRQQTLVADVAGITELAIQQGLRPPALLIVGQVVKLRNRLNWFEKRPLLGRGVLVTRAREQASTLVEALESLGACCYQFPTIKVEALADQGPVHKELGRLSAYDWLIFTSVNGVCFFWQFLEDQGADARSLAGNKVAAIGPATAAALADRGVRADFVPGKYVAEEIVNGLLDLGIRGQRVLIPRAMKAREVLPDQLSRAGVQVKVLPVYQTVLASNDSRKVVENLKRGAIQYLTFTSSSTVENFFQLLDPGLIKGFQPGLRLACIGPITARTLENHGFQADILAREYTIPGLVSALQADVLEEQDKARQTRKER